MLNKRMMAAVTIAAILAGCEGTEEEASYRLKSVAVLDQTDSQTALMTYSYSASGVLNRLDTYTGKGTDGVWETADDVLGYYSVCTFSGSGSATYRDISLEYSPVPLEADAQTDWNALNARPVECADGLADYPKANEVTYNVAVGVPAVEEGKYQFERTGSNTSRWTTQVSAVATEARTRDFFYVINGAGGLDGILVEEKVGTDTKFIGYYKYTFNSEGRLTRREFRDDPGVNELWGDSDDGVHSYDQISRSGNLVTLRSYNGTGTDSTWFNDNDAQSGYIIYQYGNSMLQSETKASDAGADEVWGSSDDVLTVKNFSYEKI